MMSNWVLASAHSRSGIFHWLAAWRKAATEPMDMNGAVFGYVSTCRLARVAAEVKAAAQCANVFLELMTPEKVQPNEREGT
jgi:hypothetical protein